jgi:hypothetical protein
MIQNENSYSVKALSFLVLYSIEAFMRAQVFLLPGSKAKNFGNSLYFNNEKIPIFHF